MIDLAWALVAWGIVFLIPGLPVAMAMKRKCPATCGDFPLLSLAVLGSFWLTVPPASLLASR
ncbi:MAG: hypothetical protein KDD44_00210, partial [Bdellovibrionales bacterium]|nr:hypothetical protein [Bdellovibrionales bacterium]